MRLVVALGGNALLRRDDPPTYEVQRRNVERAAASIAALARDHDVVITHGNGPQVGLLAESLVSGDAPLRRPLDALVAETQALIGYELCRELDARLPGRESATLVTRVVVARGDPAFGDPTKPIGAVYEEEEARRLADEHGWSIAEEESGWRRVVPSPDPVAVVEGSAVAALMERGILVVCAGGGGVPVSGVEGGRRGVEAVVDKDLTASLLGVELGAEALVILTDVDGLYRDFGGPDEERIDEITADELRALDLPEGSMAPKAEACIRFVESTGGFAVIGPLDGGGRLLTGGAGTRVVAG